MVAKRRRVLNDVGTRRFAGGRDLGAKEEGLMRLSRQLDSDQLLSAVHLALSDWNHLGGGDDDLLESLLLIHEERENIDDWRNPPNARFP